MIVTIDGSNLNTIGVINSKTAQNTTSGTAIDFTGIPAGVKRITVMFNGVSTNGSSIVQVQVGAGSIQAAGYVCGCGIQGNANNTGLNTYTTGFAIQGNTASDLRYGAYTLYNISANTWVCSGTSYNTTAPYSCETNGVVTLSGTLDRLRLTTVNGTDVFDAGSVNILYE